MDTNRNPYAVAVKLDEMVTKYLPDRRTYRRLKRRLHERYDSIRDRIHYYLNYRDIQLKQDENEITRIEGLINHIESTNDAPIDSLLSVISPSILLHKNFKSLSFSNDQDGDDDNDNDDDDDDDDLPAFQRAIPTDPQSHPSTTPQGDLVEDEQKPEKMFHFIFRLTGLDKLLVPQESSEMRILANRKPVPSLPSVFASSSEAGGRAPDPELAYPRRYSPRSTSYHQYAPEPSPHSTVTVEKRFVASSAPTYYTTVRNVEDAYDVTKDDDERNNHPAALPGNNATDSGLAPDQDLIDTEDFFRHDESMFELLSADDDNDFNADYDEETDYFISPYVPHEYLDIRPPGAKPHPSEVFQELSTSSSPQASRNAAAGFVPKAKPRLVLDMENFNHDQSELMQDPDFDYLDDDDREALGRLAHEAEKYSEQDDDAIIRYYMQYHKEIEEKRKEILKKDENVKRLYAINQPSRGVHDMDEQVADDNIDLDDDPEINDIFKEFTSISGSSTSSAFE